MARREDLVEAPTMAKYIEREELVEWIKHIPLKDLSDGLGLCRVIMEKDFKRAIRTIPAGTIIDVAPAVHGRWIEDHDYLKCAKCGVMVKWDFTFFDIGDWNYCPNCGAKMDGGED